jgi:sec-independent protein translocase protein TatB
MFDLGFSELLLVFVIALVVLGPARMPGLVSKVGKWVGKARGMARQFREQLENEVNLDELNRMTERRTKEAKAEAAQTPPPPPEFSGAPMDAPDYTNDSVASTTEAADLASEPGAPQDAQHTSDDSYSHAHTADAAPMPYTPEAAEFTPAATEVVLEQTESERNA